MGMVQGMVHDLVPIVGQCLYRFRVFIHPVAHHKKGAVYFIFIKYVYKLLGILIAPGGVKGQGHNLFVTLHRVDRQLA